MKIKKTLSKIKDRIIETDKGYFYDTEAGYYIKLSEEIEDVIDAPASDFQEEGERWATVEDLLDEQLDNIPSIQPKTTSTDIEEIKKETIKECIKIAKEAKPVFFSSEDNKDTFTRQEMDMQFDDTIFETRAEIVEKLYDFLNQTKPHLSNKSELKKEAVREFVYHYWCYNPTTGTTVYPDSVELDVLAKSETEALKIAKKMVKDRGFYKLQTVSNLSSNEKEVSQLNKENK